VCPRGTTDKHRTTTTNSSSSHHHDSAPSRPHPLICTGAEPIHPVHGPPKLQAWPWPPETRSFFCHFGGFFFNGVINLRQCRTSSVSQSAGLLIPRSSVRFRQKLKKIENSNLHGFELHRPSSKGTKLLLQAIKAIIFQPFLLITMPSSLRFQKRFL